jgi:putative superfamily III holin-X
MTEPAGVQGWIELFRSLGQALFEVARAEAQALGEDFRRSGIHLARGLALLGGAAAVGFWTAGLLLFALIAVLMIWLQPWAAALIVAGLFVATAGLLAALGLRQLRRLESPAASVRRRVSDHLEWWQTRLLADPVPPAAAAAPLPAGGRSSPPPPLPSTPPPRIRPDDPLESLEEDEP